MSEYSSGAGERPYRSQESQSTVQHAKSAVGEVADTAKGQTQAVAGEARQQARQVADQLRNRVGDQAQHQSRRAAQGIRQWADDLASMNEVAKPDSPVSGVVQQVADQGRRAADYLDQHGLAGVAQEVQGFARRRPGAFLIGAAAAGFLIGRIAKVTGNTGSPSTPGTGATGSYGSGAHTPAPSATVPPPPVQPTVSTQPATVPAQPLAQPPVEPYRTQPVTPQEEFGGPGTATPTTPRNPGGEFR
ncbi:hypothetical protein AB0G15_04535 [Streptosporangium sp. NPDC023825]|uniref:hypothetical protein n=1 Tax=Streptosporangium sp. NPDC023825 TaxID=3154909 RepID=UPI003416BBA1